MSTPPTQVERFARIRQRRLPCIILLVAMCCPGTLLADRVELKTGEVFFGKILRADRREVSVRLESGGILSFRMNQVAFFRKNFIASEEWSPVLLVDEPVFQIPRPDDTSFQGSPSSPVDTEEPAGGISLGASGDLDTSLVRPPVEDPRGFRVSPPRAFIDWETSGDSSLKRFYDPVTQADLDIVDLGPTDESIETLKTRVSRAYAREVGTGLHVLQDDRVRDVPYEGWYFEFQEERDGVNIRRIWLLVGGASNALLLKYSCPEQHYGEFRRPFAESIRSFSPAATGEPTTITPPETRPETRPENPPSSSQPRTNEDPAAELLRLLRSNQDRKKSRKVVDEFLNQEDAGKR